MFKFFTRDQIDINKWNDCINHSKQNIIYGLSWYLDIVCPNWIALIKEDNEQYSSVFPLTVNRKFTINYIYQPAFTQQLGLFSLLSNNDEDDLWEVLSLVSARYNYIDYHLNAGNGSDLKPIANFFLKNKVTHHLPLNKDHQTIFNAYSENQKRNIKKSLIRNFKLEYSNDISRLISLFKKEIGINLKKVKDSDYQILSSLYKEAEQRKMSKLIFSEDIHGEIHAGAFFLHYNNSIIYLFGASTKHGKQHGAMSMIFNDVIKDNSGLSSKILDFEGSDIESIARFYKSFGAHPIPYISLKLNTLPFFLKLFKK